MTTIMMFFLSNPCLMTQLMLGHRVDIGDGLEIEFGGPDNPLEFPGHTLGQWDGEGRDYLYFSFFLEGKHIGGLDHDFGGCVVPNYDDGELVDDDDPMLLHSQVTDRMNELFPNVYP